MNLQLNKEIQKDTPLFSIGSAAKMIGISVHTLRMYEREGLIIPHKEEGHNRLFSQGDIERLACVRRAIREKKFSISAIKMLFSFIPCWKLKGCPPEKAELCEAYSGTEQPCWLYNHKQNNTFCADQNCRECDIYNRFKECYQIKAEINKLLREK